MAAEQTALRSRRALLGGAIGALAAVAVQALGRPLPLKAAGDSESLYNDQNGATVLSAVSVVNGDGLHPSSGKGIGLHGKSDLADAVKGESYAYDKSGVVGMGWNGGTGVNGVGRVGVFGISSENGWFGIWGRHLGNSPGINGDSDSGPGIQGGSVKGYGGSFSGGKAQLWLNPKGTTGRPTSGKHAKGEIYMDSRGALFICVAGGTPGSWRKVATTAA